MARTDHRNRTRYWQTPTVPGVSCLVADFTQHDFAPHRHEALVIAATESGGAEFRSGGRTQEATTSGLLVFNPDEPHSSRMARSVRWRYRSVYLAAPALRMLQHATGLNDTPYFSANILRDDELIRSFFALHDTLEQAEAADGASHGAAPEALPEASHSAALLHFFGELALRHGGRSERGKLASGHGARGGRSDAVAGNDALIATVKRTAHERFRENLSLETLGAPVGLNPFQLIALFKRGTGLTPHAYITQLRLKDALAEMKRGTALAKAALRAGFYDQSAFTRHFKRSYGITPLQWIRARPLSRQFSPIRSPTSHAACGPCHDSTASTTPKSSNSAAP